MSNNFLPYYDATTKQKSSSFLIWALLCTMVWLCGTGKVYGQRVYANAQDSDATILASVQNQMDATDTDTTNFSRLTVSLGVLGLVSASQNLKFTGAIRPIISSPVIVKFSAIHNTASILNLLGGVKLVRTNNGNEVETGYSGQELLNLLGLFSSGHAKDVALPSSVNLYDGVKLNASTVLGLAFQARYYYAFFIAHPTLNNQTICSGTNATLAVTNPQANYKYKLYTSAIGGSAIDSTLGTTFTISNLSLGTHTYYVEAIEPGITAYHSGRAPVTITVNPLPTITLTSPIYACIGSLAVSLPYTATTNSPTTYSISWSGSYGFNPITNDLLPINNIPITIPTTVSIGNYNGTLTVRNNNNGTQCNSANNNFSISIQAHPNAAPVLTSFQ